MVGLAAAAGCGLDGAGGSLPPVTPLPLKVVRPIPFTPTSTLPTATSTVVGTSRPALRPDSVVDFAAWGSATELRAMAEVISAFERVEPGIGVKIRLDSDITPDATRAALRGPTPLGVTRVSPDDVFDFTASGLLLPLDPLVERDLDVDALVPQALGAQRGPGGEVGALSLGGAYLSVFYNEAHLELAGVELPTNWASGWDIQDFEEVARRLVIGDGKRTDRFGLAYVPWVARAWLASAAGGKISGSFFSSDESRSTMRIGPHTAALRRMADWQTRSDFEFAVSGRLADPFNWGQVSLYVDASDFASSVRPAVRWGLAPLPTWSESDALTAGTELCLGIDARTPEPESAWRLASFFLEVQAQRALARHDAVVPYRRELLRDPAFLDPNRPPLDRSVWITAAEYALQGPANPGGKAWNFLTDTPINAVRDGSVDAETYLEDADIMITRQLRARDWSVAKSQPGYRQGNQLVVTEPVASGDT